LNLKKNKDDDFKLLIIKSKETTKEVIKDEIETDSSEESFKKGKKYKI